MKASVWKPIAAAHQARAEGLLRERQSNPIETFLWTYYRTRPVHLTFWHPGAGIELEEAPEYHGRRGYRLDGDRVFIDPEFIAKHRTLIERIHHLLSATASRSAQFGCFGMHEWAMVYQADQVRHDVPLRFSLEETSRIVDQLGVRCSHYDAFRFFTAPARPLNLIQPSRELQPALEQPGCIHANMDLLKWALKLVPMIPSELLLDAFENARALRQLDMQASPYDLSGFGMEAVKVETPEGRAQYKAEQERLAELSKPIRAAMIAVCESLLTNANHPVVAIG